MCVGLSSDRIPQVVLSDSHCTLAPSALTDKGFLIATELEKLGCLCWIPPMRRRGQDQCTAEESEVCDGTIRTTIETVTIAP